MADTTPIRVLRIIPTIDPEVGGPSNSAVNAAIAEQGAGVRTTFIFTGDAQSRVSTATARARLETAGVTTLMFPRPRAFSRRAGLWGISVPMAVWVMRHVREFDVVHVHYVWAFSTVWGAIAGAATGRPVVLTAHESLTHYDIDTASGSTVKRSAKLAVRRLLMRCVTVVVSASSLEERDSLLAGERGVVLPHPVVADPLRRPPPEPPGTPLTIGYLGRIHEKKNVDVLLRAFAQLDIADAQLIICGDGDAALLHEFRELACELRIESRVDWRGHVSAEGRTALFEQCHLTAMPSAYECFGMAAAEALSAGVPVIVSGTTGVASIVEEFGAGVVVKAGDPVDLAAAIRGMNQEMVRRHHRDQAIEMARDRFSFAAYGTGIAVAYGQLLCGQGVGRA